MIFNYLNKDLSFTETSIAYSVSGEHSFVPVEIYKDDIHEKGYKLSINYMFGFHYNDNNNDN